MRTCIHRLLHLGLLSIAVITAGSKAATAAVFTKDESGRAKPAVDNSDDHDLVREIQAWLAAQAS